MGYIPVPLSTCTSCFSQLLTSFGPKGDVKGGYRKWRVVVYIFTEYYQDDQIHKNDMGKECSSYDRYKKYM